MPACQGDVRVLSRDISRFPREISLAGDCVRRRPSCSSQDSRYFVFMSALRTSRTNWTDTYGVITYWSTTTPFRSRSLAFLAQQTQTLLDLAYSQNIKRYPPHCLIVPVCIPQQSFSELGMGKGNNATNR
jgi:hypothetical protein